MGGGEAVQGWHERAVAEVFSKGGGTQRLVLSLQHAGEGLKNRERPLLPADGAVREVAAPEQENAALFSFGRSEVAVWREGGDDGRQAACDQVAAKEVHALSQRGVAQRCAVLPGRQACVGQSSTNINVVSYSRSGRRQRGTSQVAAPEGSVARRQR